MKNSNNSYKNKNLEACNPHHPTSTCPIPRSKSSLYGVQNLNKCFTSCKENVLTNSDIEYSLSNPVLPKLNRMVVGSPYGKLNFKNKPLNRQSNPSSLTPNFHAQSIARFYSSINCTTSPTNGTNTYSNDNTMVAFLRPILHNEKQIQFDIKSENNQWSHLWNGGFPAKDSFIWSPKLCNLTKMTVSGDRATTVTRTTNSIRSSSVGDMTNNNNTANYYNHGSNLFYLLNSKPQNYENYNRIFLNGTKNSVTPLSNQILRDIHDKNIGSLTEKSNNASFYSETASLMDNNMNNNSSNNRRHSLLCAINATNNSAINKPLDFQPKVPTHLDMLKKEEYYTKVIKSDPTYDNPPHDHSQNYDYTDPVIGAPKDFIKRLNDLHKLTQSTKQWELSRCRQRNRQKKG